MIYIYFMFFNGGEALAASHKLLPFLLAKEKKIKSNIPHN